MTEGRITDVGSRISGMRAQAGFTLIEIMVALAILAVLGGLLYGTFNATYRVAEQMDAEADLDRMTRLGFYHLAQDLSMVHQSQSQTLQLSAAGLAAPLTSPTGAPAAPIAPALVFKGIDGTRSAPGGAEFPYDSIQFTAVSHGRTSPDAPESDLALISYFLQDDLLIYEAQLSDGRVAREEVGEGVRGLNFRYLDPTSLLWVDQWDSEASGNRLPLAVEIELVFTSSVGKIRSFKTWVELPLGGA